MATNEKEPEQKAWAGAVRAVFPTFKNGGTHVNISGVSLVKTAPNKAAALKLVEFMVSDAAQKLYAELNYEYPVKPGIAVTPLI
ncbi:extracellular solute-binding protein, partial [Mycobacterium tuberculosis]|nr:extracellular solute-binding protein [Mycobacterium tuberculosis]